VLWLRRRPGFDPRSVHVRFVVHKVVVLVEMQNYKWKKRSKSGADW